MSQFTNAPSESELIGLLGEVVKETGIPGVGLVVSVEGQKIEAYVGRASVAQEHGLGGRSKFEVSCLMKFYTSLLALELARRERINLDAPIAEYLPELYKPEFAAELRVRHLLSHTSGYLGLDITDSRVKWAYSWSRFIEHFQTTRMSFPPGLVFNYEHSEHVILGEILNRVCGSPLGAVLQQEIFGPLGIIPGRSTPKVASEDTYVGQHSYQPSSRRFEPISIPAFGPFWASSLPDMTMTLNDQIAVSEALFESANRSIDSGVFSRSTVAAIRKPVIAFPQTVSTGMLVERMPRAFSLGCGHYDLELLGHNGSMPGQTCALRFNLERRFALSVGVNAWAPHARDAIIDRAVALCFGHAPTFMKPLPRRQAFVLTQLTGGFALSDLVGTYCGGYFGRVSVSLDGDTLHFRFGRPGSGGVEVFARRLHERHQYALDCQALIAIGFFRDPITSGPALMANVHSYKKMDS
jgi:CubicO group peptidase (beta-lactamase class C family)